jgi:hypothetical protein
VKTSKQTLRDTSIRRQAEVRRYDLRVRRQVLAMLDQSDQDLVDLLNSRLRGFSRNDLATERWKALLKKVRKLREDAYTEALDFLHSDLSGFGKDEARFERELLQLALPFSLEVGAAPAERLAAILTDQPFEGHLLKEWFAKLVAGERNSLVRVLQLGISRGMSSDDIVRQITGTKSASYGDGILGKSRQGLQAVIQTAISHVSSAARDSVWEANSDIPGCLIWAAVLDGRTSAICRAMDGHGIPTGGTPLPKGVPPVAPEGLRPPAHLRCRSTLVFQIDGIGLVGSRPYVTDTRTAKQRKIDFEEMASETGRSVQDVRTAWANENIGHVSAATTYEKWLASQDVKFQDSVLGKAKGKLFREGGLRLDDFVDASGKELTLKELREMNPAAFVKAHLDP